MKKIFMIATVAIFASSCLFCSYAMALPSTEITVVIDKNKPMVCQWKKMKIDGVANMGCVVGGAGNTCVCGSMAYPI